MSEKAEAGNLCGTIKYVNQLREHLTSAIFGQDGAIDDFVNGYYRALLTEGKNPQAPVAVFLFAGPPGTGKTLTAQTFAEFVKKPFKRFDMSEYSHRDSLNGLVGAAPFWRGACAGVLTSYVSENPNAVLLFDELEKANITVIHLFLQILDGAVLYDKFTGNYVSFSDTTIIITTNAGKQLYTDSEQDNLTMLPKQVILDALINDINPATKEPYFPPAICSRFARGNVIMFNHMKPEFLVKVTAKSAEDLFQLYMNKFGLNISVEENVYAALMYSEGISSDARSLTGKTEAFFNDELFELFQLVILKYGAVFLNDIKSVCFRTDLTDISDSVIDLFYDTYTSDVVLLSNTQAANTVSLYKDDRFRINLVHSFDEAEETIKKIKPAMVIIDLSCGAKSHNIVMSVDDIDSDGKKLFDYINSKICEMPIYIAESAFCEIRGVEKRKLLSAGAAGFVSFDISDKSKTISEIKKELFYSHKMKSALKIASSGKQLKFDTRQMLSDDKTTAEITLYDFRTVTAIKSGDKDSITSEMSRPDLRFSDIIGAEDAKSELRYFVNYLKDPRQFAGMGVSPPKGVLLYGPPGTGKTMLAKATAGESDITFISTDGTSLLSLNNPVKKLFKKARKYAPAIIFIDEIDIIGKYRGSENSVRGADAVLNELLTEMDGFKSYYDKPVFVLAATNYGVNASVDRLCLDPALVRRFDRHIFVDLPSKEERYMFISKCVSENNAIDISEQFISDIASRSVGMNLAALKSVVDFSLRAAIIAGSATVNDVIFNEAFESYCSGEKNKINDKSFKRIAYHEAGHAVVSCAFGKCPLYLTVVSRGDYGGYMLHDTDEEDIIVCRSDIIKNIAVTLGGAASERVFFGEHSSGAAGDLRKGTILSADMLYKYGMFEEQNLMSADAFGQNTMYKENDADNNINRLLSKILAYAEEIISVNKTITALVAEKLIEKGHMNKSEISDMLAYANVSLPEHNIEL